MYANEGFIKAHFFIDFWINVLYNVYINLLVMFKWLVILYKNIVTYILGVCETGWLYQWYSTLSWYIIKLCDYNIVIYKIND